MNPWQSFRREIDGAMRSIRYDLSAKQSKRAKHAMTRETVALPTVRPRSAKDRRRFYTVAAAVLLPVAGASGYFAVTSGLDALFPGEGTPNGLPATSLDPKSPAPSPQAPLGADPAAVKDPLRGRPAPRTSPVPDSTAPIPTPAPTCQCTPPPPPPTPAPTTQSPSPSPSPSMSPWPTNSTPPGGSPSPRPTWRSMP